MAGRLGHGQLSMTPRAIKWRKLQAEANLEWQRTNLVGVETVPENGVSDQDHVADQGVAGDSSIGVFKPTSPPELPGPLEPPVSPDEPDTYFCQNCRADIEYGAEACPVCEKKLSWEELA